ncbi:DUF1707 domain-containing protein [Mycobacterium sp. Root135]|uniref:DUF1707 SHOCT-like domain-containing protein n=1 Tax=Mycobacterium sp. Root135 TaxID=1736457 RepID=UPI0009EBA298|nr:DUF1707 domain-containing protein [Mycobacterium sp. Root135]
MATRQTAGTRAKDSDRNNTCQVLDSALGDGQLSGEEHRIRVAAATTAATLGDLQQLVEDLQNDNAPVQMPDLKKPSRMIGGDSGWGMRAAVAGVLVVLGIAIGWGLYGNTTSPLSFTSDPGAKSDGIPAKVITPPKQLQSLGGLTGLMEQMRQRFGDTMGYGLTIYPDYAVLYRPDPTDDRRKLNYTYRGGFDDPYPATKSSDDTLVDLSAFDVKTVVGIIRGAPETVGLQQKDVEADDTYLTIDPARDPTMPGTLTLRVSVSSDFGSGSITFAGDGTIKRIDGPPPK